MTVSGSAAPPGPSGEPVSGSIDGVSSPGRPASGVGFAGSPGAGGKGLRQAASTVKSPSATNRLGERPTMVTPDYGAGAAIGFSFPKGGLSTGFTGGVSSYFG